MELAIVAKDHHREAGSLIVSKPSDYLVRDQETRSIPAEKYAKPSLAILDKDNHSACWPRFRLLV